MSARRELYGRLVDLHATELHRFALRLCNGRRDAAEDLLQETFKEAWRSIGRLQNPDRGRAWLFQILRHRFARVVRDDKKRNLVLLAAADSVGDREQATEDVIVLRDRMQKALDLLDEKHRIPFLMVFMDGATCQHVADALELPLGTVLSRIHRAKRMLRTHLTARDVEHEGVVQLETARSAT